MKAIAVLITFFVSIPVCIAQASSPVVTNQSAQTVSSTLIQAPEEIGEVTKRLLAAQANSNRAGASHQMLGTTATHTWNRYVESFKHDIPDTFERIDMSVKK